LTGSFSESPQYIVFRATVTAIPFPSKNAAKISSLEKAVVTTTISWIKVLHCTLSTMWKIKGWPQISIIIFPESLLDPIRAWTIPMIFLLHTFVKIYSISAFSLSIHTGQKSLIVPSR
jgi:hypothetical protein